MTSTASSTLVWLVPLLPLLASAAIAALGRGRRTLTTGVAVAGCVGASLVAASEFVAIRSGRVLVSTLPWFRVGELQVALSSRVDPLAAVVALVVALVSTAVTMYAVSYMAGEERHARFFATLALFVSAMQALVIADDVLLFFVAWEMVGLCSYLLIGFWFERDGVAPAATQAFLVTRVGDVALLAGLLMAVRLAGTSSLAGISSIAVNGRLIGTPTVIAAALIVVGAFAKSAQLPFSAWLPDAMVGPTPVSALLHAATMVAAGAYLVARVHPLLAVGAVLPAVAWIGVLTALYGSLCALGQRDLKRLLAYSTMGQLGFMFAGLGAGSIAAGMVLLVSHAAFKSLLFLSAGNVQHAVDSTRFADMGGLARRMPRTAVLFAVGAAALAGVPTSIALAAKDTVLEATAARSIPLFAVSLIASALTAAYAVRAFSLAFLGDRHSDRPARAEADRAGFVGPELALAVLLVLIGVADSPLIGEPLRRALGDRVGSTAWVTTLALLTTAIGAMAGFRWTAAEARHRPVFDGGQSVVATESGLGLAAAYARMSIATVGLARASRTFDEATFARPSTAVALLTVRGARALRRVDVALFDRTADGFAGAAIRVVHATGNFDLRRIDAAFNSGAEWLAQGAERLRLVQTGRVYNYLLAIVAWGLAAVILAVVMVAISVAS